MNTIKKMISTFLLITLFISNFSYTFANNQNIYKQIILVKKDLKSQKQGEKYIKTIDEIVERYKTNKTKLEKLKIKTGELVKKLENNDSVKYRKTKQIVRYLDLKVQISIHDIERALLKEKLIEKLKRDEVDGSIKQIPLPADISSNENK